MLKTSQKLWSVQTSDSGYHLSQRTGPPLLGRPASPEMHSEQSERGHGCCTLTSPGHRLTRHWHGPIKPAPTRRDVKEVTFRSSVWSRGQGDGSAEKGHSLVASRRWSPRPPLAGALSRPLAEFWGAPGGHVGPTGRSARTVRLKISVLCAVPARSSAIHHWDRGLGGTEKLFQSSQCDTCPQ